MPHFTDYMQYVSKQTFSAAAIIDSDGKSAGKIIVRYTDATIGYNHNVCVLFYPVDGMNYSNTKKGGTYNEPATLVQMLESNNITAYLHDGNRVTSDYDLIYGKRRKTPNKRINNNISHAESMSRFSDISSIKYKRKKYNLVWVM